MLFLGYWSFWFLLGFVLALSGKVRFTGDYGSLVVLLIWSCMLAIPSSLIHCAFLR